MSAPPPNTSGLLQWVFAKPFFAIYSNRARPSPAATILLLALKLRLPQRWPAHSLRTDSKLLKSSVTALILLSVNNQTYLTWLLREFVCFPTPGERINNKQAVQWTPSSCNSRTYRTVSHYSLPQCPLGACTVYTSGREWRTSISVTTVASMNRPR